MGCAARQNQLLPLLMRDGWSVNTTGLVDLDDPTTWPSPAYVAANRWAKRLRGTTEYVTDLNLATEDEDSFRALLRGHPLRAFHATRLLDHEVEGIRDQGLLVASQDLVRARLSAAYEAGALDDELRRLLLTSNVFHEGDARYRSGQVCLILGRRTFDHSPHGVGPLMSEWGGELITMSRGGAVLRPRLRRLGTPAIVVVRVELSESWRIHSCFPSLHKLFVGRLLELQELGADVFLRRPVPSKDVLDIWQPGHPDFDLHPHIPRN